MAIDDFERPDDPELGPNWLPLVGLVGFTVAGGEARSDNGGEITAERYQSDTPPDDQKSACVLGIVEDQLDKGAGPAARMSATEATCYRAWANLDASGEFQYGKVIAETITILGSYTAGAVPAPGQALEVRCEGTRISVWVDDVEVAFTTDASIASGSAGMFAVPWSTTPTLASWTGGSLVEEEQEASLTWLVPIAAAA